MSDELRPGQVWHNPRGTMTIIIHEVDGERVRATSYAATPGAPVEGWTTAAHVIGQIREYGMVVDR